MEETMEENHRPWRQRCTREARYDSTPTAPLITVMRGVTFGTRLASLQRHQKGDWAAAVRRWSRDNGGTRNKEWTSVTTSFALRGQVSQQMENGA